MRRRPPVGTGHEHRARRLRSHVAALTAVVAGAVLGWALPRWERHLPVDGLDFDAGTAQATLAAIAASMITLAGFVVTAITLVVQTIQSLSPRLVGALGHFGQYLLVFGLLVGTALYALVALSGIDSDEPTPRLTVTFAIVLVLAATTAVVFLLSALQTAVTPAGLSRAVADGLREAVDAVYPPGDPEPDGDQEARHHGPRTAVRHLGTPGVIRSVDEKGLTRLAAAHDLRIELCAVVGDFVSYGQTLALFTPPHKPQPKLDRQIAGCLHLGTVRTMEQDPPFGLRLLADIGIRSLSPAVNDPTTAVQILDQITDALTRISGRPLGPALLTDPDGVPRVLCSAPHWTDLLTLGLDEIILYGSAHPQVVRRLHAALDTLEATAPPVRAAAVAGHRRALERLAAAHFEDPLLRTLTATPDPQGLGGPPRPGHTGTATATTAPPTPPPAPPRGSAPAP
ncbi:DUF2254 family protein [Streptomyces sp. NPDC002054]|uniref:DUF2254 domain-containing protein n=1 Tax=Streptomyces sp. NPDC002054 TaxID=3154663 RepID=UPI0033314EEB